jgi:hypothetical protein
MRIHQLITNEQIARPAELGDAYFWIQGRLVDIYPERNHRDWLIKHQSNLSLPDYIQQKPVRALWEAYKKGIIRIVWDRGGKWKTGPGHQQGNVLYLNGMYSIVWHNIRSILNDPKWLGQVTTVVIEYVQEKDNKPNWYRTDIFRGGSLESLYRGKKPRVERLPPNATYGGEPDIHILKEINHTMNMINDQSGSVMEMFNTHIIHYFTLPTQKSNK